MTCSTFLRFDNFGRFCSGSTSKDQYLFTMFQQGSDKAWIGTRGIPSPDGLHLAILSVRLNSSVWMMENF
jgi:hypothetical protein